MWCKNLKEHSIGQHPRVVKNMLKRSVKKKLMQMKERVRKKKIQVRSRMKKIHSLSKIIRRPLLSSSKATAKSNKKTPYPAAAQSEKKKSTKEPRHKSTHPFAVVQSSKKKSYSANN